MPEQERVQGTKLDPAEGAALAAGSSVSTGAPSSPCDPRKGCPALGAIFSSSECPQRTWPPSASWAL